MISMMVVRMMGIMVVLLRRGDDDDDGPKWAPSVAYNGQIVDSVVPGGPSPKGWLEE
jgi:hypothetical protein